MAGRSWERSALGDPWHIVPKRAAVLIGLACAIAVRAAIGFALPAATDGTKWGLTLVGGAAVTWLVMSLAALVEQRNAACRYVKTLETEDARVPVLLALKAEGQRLLNARYTADTHAPVSDDDPLLAWGDRAFAYLSHQWPGNHYFGFIPAVQLRAIFAHEREQASAAALPKKVEEQKARILRMHEARIYQRFISQARETVVALGERAQKIRTNSAMGLQAEA